MGIMSPSQHHIIDGFGSPAVWTTAAGSAPVTSKYTLPVAVWPCAMVAPEMPAGLDNCHNTWYRVPGPATAKKFGMIGVIVPDTAYTDTVASQS